MVTFKYRWMTAFGISLSCHAMAIVLIGVAAFLFPHESVDKSPIEVDLVSFAGGGGGGGSPEAGPEIDSPVAQPTEIPPAPTQDIPYEEIAEDVHEIPSDIKENTERKTESFSSANTSSGRDSTRGYGSGTGTGGGDGSGTGTGTGSGTGPGTGSGSGGGDGTGVGTGDTIGPQILSNPSPQYPESSRAANREGTTSVEFIIGVDGTVTSAWVEVSSGDSALDDAAVNAVYGWQVVPAKQNGIAVESRSRVPINFHLKSSD